MPKTKKLQNQIEKKLETLKEHLEEINEALNIDSNDPDTWDSDTLYNLVEKCKEVIKLLEDKEHSKEKDNFGQPIILETGLLSLIDEYQSEEEESEEDI